MMTVEIQGLIFGILVEMFTATTYRRSKELRMTSSSSLGIYLAVSMLIVGSVALITQNYAIVLLIIGLPLLFMWHTICRCHLIVAFSIWFLVSPIIGNYIQNPSRNPFLRTPSVESALSAQSAKTAKNDSVHEARNPITIFQLVTFDRLTILLFLWIALGRKRISLDTTEIWMLLFSSMILYNLFSMSGNWHFALSTAGEAWLFPFLAYVAARRIVKQPQQLFALQQALIYFGVFVIVIVLIERFLHSSNLFYRVGGPLRNGSILGLCLYTVFFSSLSLHMSGKNGGGLSRFVLWLTPVAIVLTLSRGLMVGCLGGAAVFLFSGRHLMQQKRKIFLMGVVIITCTVGLATFEIAKNATLIQGRLLDSNTILARQRTEIEVLMLGLESPVLGIGLNNLRIVLPGRKSRIGGYAMDTSHNSFLSLWAETGMLGFALLMGVYVSLLLSTSRIRRFSLTTGAKWASIGSVSLIVAYIAPCMFANTLYLGDLAPILLFLYAGSVAGAYATQSRVAGNNVSMAQTL